MKIDVFCHVMPRKFAAALEKKAGEPIHGADAALLVDMEKRLREIHRFDGLKQILTIGAIEMLDCLPAKTAADLACVANDAMAELVHEYKDDFLGGIATVSMNDPTAAVKEIDRAVNQLGLKGIQVSTTINGESLASEKFLPIFEKMAEVDLPILVHPCHGTICPPEMVFNWPMETSWMMINLSTSGIFERFPNIKFLTHHCGAFIPVFHNRLYLAWYLNHMYPKKAGERSPEEYFDNLRKFYNDTALYGDCTKGLEAGVEFFGADHVLFGTDFPLNGDRNPECVGETENTIKSIERMNITDEDRALIFEGNARRIFKL